MLLISVSGLDGSGKSTLTQTLKIAIESEVECKVYVVALLQRAKESVVRAQGEIHHENEKSPDIDSLDSIARSLFHEFNILRREVPSNAVVLLDRYVRDYCATQASVFGYNLRDCFRAFYAFPKADIEIFLDLSVADALRRIELRGERRGVFETEELLEKKYRTYRVLNKVWRPTIILQSNLKRNYENRVMSEIVDRIRQAT